MLNRSKALLLVVVTVLMLVPALAGHAVVVAAAGGVQNPADGVVVATQLLNPRGLTIAPNGTLYIAEAGSGGPEPIVDPDFGLSTRGFTGRVTAIARDGTRTVIADDLPSTALGGFEPLGPAGVTLARGRLYLAVGLTNAGYAPRSGDASVYGINPHNGKRSILTYLGGYEFAQNPDGFGLESNPYGIAYSGGSLYVADAGGNSLYRIDPRTGQFTLVTVFEGLPLPFPFENGGRGGANEEDPVPTGLAGARDGVYVTLLGGFPFAPGLSKAVHVAADGAVTDVALGLTLPVAAAVGPDGALFITEFAQGLDVNTFSYYPNSGRVLRVLPDGTTDVVIDGLNLPNGLAFDKRGNLYVTVNSNNPPSAGAQGAVLRFENVAGHR